MKFMVQDKAFYRSFFRLTLVIALQNIISFGVNLSDNIMLGGYSESALSGVALANQIQFLLQMLVMGVGEGVVILSSRAWGARDMGTIKRVASIGMRLALLLALLLWLAVFLFPHGCLSLFTNEDSVIAEGAKYLRIIGFSYLFFAATNLLLASLRSVETVRVGFILSVSTLLINVCLNYLLIYGHFGFPAWGVRGSAAATLTARIIELAIVVGYLKRVDRKIRFALRDFFQFDRGTFKQYLSMGSPILMSNALWGLAMAVQSGILGHMGEAAIAANSIATTVFQIVSVVTYASASATAVIIGKTIGAGHPEKIKPYAQTLQVLYVIIGLGTGAVLFLIKDMVLGFYAISPASKDLALQFMTVLSITAVGTAYQMPALTGIVRSGGDTKFVLYNDFIFMWLIVLPSAFLCAAVLGLSPLLTFICLKSDQILKCLVAIVKVNRYRWIRTFGNPEPRA
ncbi:MATE efflux family protein [Paenibacillus sp. oral taxon 786 str. D14]|uniref:MATE family efflux transporter n=1 Tax=Paenibacillus sp. oral taxon 786 TaxID=652715 RepID=UPI0001AFCC06|nr:MATE family efflux transporter [Paenibacillus sp. oral taxon 786]EES73611.1 MATE efflux family protein [Paenibacillus sp. oral taxon 786 str. D14]